MGAPEGTDSGLLDMTDEPPPIAPPLPVELLLPIGPLLFPIGLLLPMGWSKSDGGEFCANVIDRGFGENRWLEG